MVRRGDKREKRREKEMSRGREKRKMIRRRYEKKVKGRREEQSDIRDEREMVRETERGER